jgi:catechol 2,3-dioxygenase-like lactoylglutathione lyase family enzyme
VSDHEHLSGVAFGRMASTIAVRDLPRALAFYVGIMGMHVTFENGDPAGFAILERDAAELHLTVARDHQASTSNVAHLLVTDATELYDHLNGHGVRIDRPQRADERGRASPSELPRHPFMELLDEEAFLVTHVHGVEKLPRNDI